MSPARFGALALLLVLLVVPTHAASAQEQERQAIVVLVPGASLEQLFTMPDVAAVARAGGAALLARSAAVRDYFEGSEVPGSVRLVATPVEQGDLRILVDRIANNPAGFEATEVLLIVVGADLSAGTESADDAVVMAVGDQEELFSDDASYGSLTSDSTRRAGVVIGEDVRSTIVEFLGRPTRGALGERIKVIEGPPPFELYERYLAQRRLYVPIGTAAAVYLGIAGLFAVALAIRPAWLPGSWRRVGGWAALSVAMLPVGLLGAGHLPELTYASAVPMVAIVTVFGTLAFSPLERADVTVVPAGIGAAVLALFALEAALGWDGMLTPLVGGSQLDGGRFFGLPNVGIGVLAGAALWVAQRLRTRAGVVLLCAAGLFAGLPLLGSNLGGSTTLFAAAGLWLALRERDRLGRLPGLAAAAGITVLGTIAILVAHAVSPVETHVTRFERTTDGLGGVVERLLDRWEVGVDLIARNPAALVPVVGLPLALLAVLRPPAAIRATFERWPAWRDAVLVTLLAGVVAYVANDSGPAAAGFAFGLGLGGMLGVSLLASPGKMGEP